MIAPPFFFTQITLRIACARLVSFSDNLTSVSPESRGRSIAPWNGPHKTENAWRTGRVPRSAPELSRTGQERGQAIPMAWRGSRPLRPKVAAIGGGRRGKAPGGSVVLPALSVTKTRIDIRHEQP